MDNNLNNGSDIANVSGIKFDDTPAESFDKLYGGNSNVQGNAGAVSPNPAINSNVQSSFGPSTQPAQAAPSVQPTQVVQPVQAAPSVQPTPVVQPMQAAPSVQPTPVVQPTQAAPSVQPTPVVQPTQAAPGVVQNLGVNIQPQSNDLSNINIDENKMQSIEEQLSKTSQYNPEDIQKEMISISTDNQSDKSKSGLGFVIVLFIILALVIIFLPQITKLIS